MTETKYDGHKFEMLVTGAHMTDANPIDKDCVTNMLQLSESY